eukprot:TRINITY_DN531_c0_g1_i1.p1 TRINITY_DN531_c0_g1~~TRINITY_DN531_c0_g1_i1.p1  ORF type:complete len:842 (+),score=370.77 TRINITY_DN531_c0_g1_i1:314-2839(+)
MMKFVLLLLFVLVATITADIDIDGDGFFSDDPDPRFVDCCDTVLDGCNDPYMVNPGAYPFFGDSELNDCQTRDNFNYDNFCDRGFGTISTGFTGPNVNFATTELLASAMDICSIIEDDDDPRYGFFRVNNMVIELANGEREGWDATPDVSGPFDSQVSVLENFCEIFPRKENGGTMAALSTGSLCFENCGTTSNNLGSDIVELPSAYLDSQAIFPEPGCNNKPQTVADSVSMRFSMRQPSNADAFSFKTKVVSAQYQSYPPTSRCDRKDWFLALKNGTIGVPPDTNIALTVGGEGFSNNVITPEFWEWCDNWEFDNSFAFFSRDVPQTIDGLGDDDVYDGCQDHPNFDEYACFSLYFDFDGPIPEGSNPFPTFEEELDFKREVDVPTFKDNFSGFENFEDIEFSDKYTEAKEYYNEKHPRDTAPREEEVFFGNEEKIKFNIKPRAEGEEIRAVANVNLGSNTVEKVTVYFVIDHPFMSDVVIDLISPQGTKVNLMTNNCELKYHYYYGISRIFEVAFDMDAEDDIDNYYCDFYDYNYNYFGYGIEKKPLGDLNEFNGEITDGEWTLVISDTVTNFDGTLLSFAVLIDPVDDDVDFVPRFCQYNDFEIDDDNVGTDDNCAYSGASMWSPWGTRAEPKEEFELKLIAFDTPTPFDDTIFLIDDYRPISEYRRHSAPFGYQHTSDLAISRYLLEGSNSFDIENPTDFKFIFTIKNWGPEDAEDLTISFTPPYGTKFDMDNLSDNVSPFDECEVKLAESPYEDSSFYKCRFSQARSLKPLNFFNGFLNLQPTDNISVGDALTFRLTATSSSIDEDYSNNYKLNIVFVPPKFKFVDNDDEDDDDNS